jgi:hypothetical protein
MSFMKPEPGGAKDAKRMMIGDAAFACGVDTAPGNRKALAARSATNACLVLFIVFSLGDAILAQ